MQKASETQVLVERNGSMRTRLLFRRFKLVSNEYTLIRRGSRLRSLARILPVWFLILGLSSCGGYPSPSLGPASALSIIKAQDLGVIPTNPDILGRDGGYSALFQD